MSTKVSLNNSIKMNSGDDQWMKSACLGTGVKLAGEESKDRLYEPKHKKKLVRVLTVVAYVFFVSLAAIMLSLYYVFLWNGNQKDGSKSRHSYEAQQTNGLCSNGEHLVEVPYEPTAIPVVEAKTEVPTPPTSDISLFDDDNNKDENDERDDEPWQAIDANFTRKLVEITKRSPMLKKLLLNKIMD